VRRHLALLAAIIAAALLVAWARPVRAANDPNLVWRTVETPHFHITYNSGEEEIAQHVADLAEAIHARLVPAVGWSPGAKTDLVLTDQTDSANGSATALPYNAVRLYVTAPDDMSPLGDVDDWYQELVTHEYTHILHTDHIRGIPAIANAILGKTFAPNQSNPRWLLEGLAVFEESKRTSGGRLRSSMWNMWMRADVLEDNIASLDVFSNQPRRWPQGNIWYLYGSFFMQWVAETYGEDAIRRMADDYGWQVIPYGINRSIRRATGRTYEQMYPSFIETLKREYGEQAQRIRARGLREGVRLTRGGQTAEHPRFLPASAWPEYAGQLVYFRDDAHTTAGFFRVPLDHDAEGHVTGSKDDQRELLIRTNGVGSLSFEPNGNAVFSSVDVHNNLFYFDDLFELPRGKKSPNGMEGERERWTDGFRALDPDVSPDGRRVVFTTNHRGTTYVDIADIVPGDGIKNTHALVPSVRFDQAFTPRWSPDNRHVAYSVWKKGGYRDIRIVDTNDGSYVDITHDRAIDGDPSYSPDGRWLVFHSDRTLGVTNIFAYELATGKLSQVTNVVNGAFQPQISPDGKTLAYIGYTSKGYDVFAIAFDEKQFLEALPYVDYRPDAPPVPEHRVFPTHMYNPFDTLRPRAYSAMTTPGNFGQALLVTASGADIAGLHSIVATMEVEFEHPALEPDVAYSFGGFPFDVNLHAYRTLTPRSDDNLVPQWIQETAGVESGIDYSLPRAFDSQSFSVTYSYARIAGTIPAPASQLNPYDTPSLPTSARGSAGFIHLGYSYSNAEGFVYSVGAEKGFSLSASLDLTNPILASDYTGFSANFNFETYLRMPWLRHHVLAMHAGGGLSGGNYPGQGVFYIGGYVDENLVNTIQNSLVQGGIVLRGYPVVAEAGAYYALFNAEYRFPIVNIDRGLSTLPIFLSRVTGNVFLDYGSAFNDAYAAEFKTGTGAELWFDFQLGYILDFTFRAGLARGLASEGITKGYFVSTIPF
jgi:hypothetical protein